MIPDYIQVTDDISRVLREFFKKNSYSKIAVLVDNNTSEYCYPLVQGDIPDHVVIKIEEGEEYKNLSTCQLIWNSLTDNQFDRKSLLINLGGGVIGDMGGFCAATYKRGIQFINIPTTLLAQVDASIGGKLGIDFHNYKNHVGLFRNPDQIIIFPGFLKTLPARELKSGFAEVIKHSLIADKEYWYKISNKSFNDQNWEDHIIHSIQVKNKVVQDDPEESGIRKILNFGHTIGHAIESYFLHQENSKLLHGEAIAIGMICEAFISNKKNNLTDAELNQISNYLTSIFDKMEITDNATEKISYLVLQDKKNERGVINGALLQEIGEAIIDIPFVKADIEEAIHFYNKL